MATYQFSALTSGQSISFSPTADLLNFDQTAISAANLGVAQEGADSRVTVLTGTDAGKNVLLLNTSLLQLATTYEGALMSDGSVPQAAREFIRFLSDPDARAKWLAAKLEPLADH